MCRRTVFALLILVFTPTIGICADFSFAGIDWSDNPDQVFQKLVDKGLVADYMVKKGPLFKTGTGDDGKPMKINLENIIHRMADDKKWKKLRDGCSVGYNVQEELGSRNKIKMMSIGSPEDSIIRGAEFSFAYDTDQLLSYNVGLSSDANFDNFVKLLIEKYGSPTETSHGYVWSNDAQSLYYFNPTQTSATIFYLNDAKINNYINDIEQLENRIQNKKTKSESEKAEKLF